MSEGSDPSSADSSPDESRTDAEPSESASERDAGPDDGVPERNAESPQPSPALPFVGAFLTVVVAGLHLLHPSHGLLKLFVILNADPGLLVFDPRSFAFVASGIALLVGLSLSRNAPNRRPYYLAGIALALTYLVGYFAWHFTGHGGFLPGREPLLHGLSPVENVVSHLTTDVWAAVSKATEIALVAVLTVLYRRESSESDR
ncbi:hypothetical protein [Halobellus salinisoli]|uniref:hypothetical protein n=1 Tax=Halobellus salinisoli TaxID=3108500 RepID=UPI003009FDD0